MQTEPPARRMLRPNIFSLAFSLPKDCLETPLLRFSRNRDLPGMADSSRGSATERGYASSCLYSLRETGVKEILSCSGRTCDLKIGVHGYRRSLEVLRLGLRSGNTGLRSPIGKCAEYQRVRPTFRSTRATRRRSAVSSAS